MRYIMLVIFFLISLPPLTPDAFSKQMVSQHDGILIRNISMEGFVLEDKSQFVKLFKPYRNKYLTTDDIGEILQKIRIIYEKEGYQQLVTISYRLIKHRLIFTALMTS